MFDSLADLKGAKSQRLGTEAGSVADYSLRQRGYLRRLFRNQLATLKALNDGDIDHAYLWANVGWTLHVSPDFKLNLVSDYVPEDHWNIAVAMRRGDDELKRHIDQAIDALINDGSVSRIMAAYHVPCYSPFPGATGDADAVPTSRFTVTSLIVVPNLGCRRSRRPNMVIPDWREFARLARSSWRWIKTTSPSRPPIPNRRVSTTRLPVCSPNNWAFAFACTGPSPRTIPTRRNSRRRHFVT